MFHNLFIIFFVPDQKTINNVGCFQSFSSWDVFNETLSSYQCNLTAAYIPGGSGSCAYGNCDSSTGICTTSQCPSPYGTCSGGSCQQCSSTYNVVYSSSMTVELCTQICSNSLWSFNFAGIIYGFAF